MGLFDMFGAGGGSLVIQPVSSAAVPGQTIVGNVIFQGGKRAQQINALTMRMTQDLRQMEMTNQGPQQRSHTRDVVPSTPIAQPFMSTPGQATTIPFSLPLPAGLQNTMANVVTYRLSVSADIPGEVDPGAGIDIQIVGGVDVAQPGMMQPGMMQQGMMQQGMMQPGMMQPGMMQPGMMAGQIQIANGTRVHAIWQGDGQMHPGTVRGFQNGMYSVDWEEPHLGASTFVYPQQIHVQIGTAAFGQHDPHAKHVDPNAKFVDPNAKHVDPHAKHVDPHGKHVDPHGKHVDPHAKHVDPHAKHVDPHAKHFTPQVGSHVTAQHPSGQWYPGRIVQMQNGMIGVDWDDAKLGQSSWVHPHQVR